MHVLAISPGEGFDALRWERILDSGIDGLMIREPSTAPAGLLRIAQWVLAQAPHVERWVNGRLDVALAAGCGLHAPESYPVVPGDLAPLSRPVHDAGQIPSRLPARQVILSPVYDVPGKGPAWGPVKLHGILDGMPPCSCRILALGGITPANAAELKHPRLDGVALIRGIWSDPDPAGVVNRLRDAWR